MENETLPPLEFPPPMASALALDLARGTSNMISSVGLCKLGEDGPSIAMLLSKDEKLAKGDSDTPRPSIPPVIAAGLISPSLIGDGRRRPLSFRNKSADIASSLPILVSDSNNGGLC